VKKRRFFKILDYLPPAVAFAAAVIAVIGSPGWDPNATGLSKVTAAGWFVLLLGAAALITSILITLRDARQSIEEEERQIRVANIAKSQLLSALGHMVYPLVGREIWGKALEPANAPLEMLNAERRNLLASLNLNSASPYADGSFAEIRWHEMIERAGHEGVERITTTLQIYASYLEFNVLEALTILLDSPFLKHRILHMHDFILANTHQDANRPIMFFFVANDRMHNDDYITFWTHMANALKVCGANTSHSGDPLFPYSYVPGSNYAIKGTSA
jgi:hypothetical protein